MEEFCRELAAAALPAVVIKKRNNVCQEDDARAQEQGYAYVFPDVSLVLSADGYPPEEEYRQDNPLERTA
jgi:hypothetical protein